MCDFNFESGTLSGTPQQVTNISTGADGGIWSPDGKNIVFVSEVYPDCKDDACNKQRDEELKKSKVKAKVFTKLFYRHWNGFTKFKRVRLFVVSADSVVAAAVSAAEPNKQALGTSASTTPRDLTPGDHDVPPFHLGGQDMYAISPDSQELAYTSNIESEAGPAFVEATSTKNAIFVVPLSASSVEAGVSPATSGTKQPGTAATTAKPAPQSVPLSKNAPRKISTSPGADTTPLYSPDGKYLAWRSQARAGFEADKWRLFVQDRQSGKTRDLTEKFDRSVGSFTWIPSSKAICFAAEDHGEAPIYSIALGSDKPVEIARLHADDLIFGPNGALYFTRMSAVAPNEIWRLLFTEPGLLNSAQELGDALATKHDLPTSVTHMNDALLSQIDMQPLESFTFKGANDEEVQGFMVKPPGFDPNKKYPLKFLIHGGPQGAWGDEWTYRWNAELFAATGNYVVVMINFHGSTGYGQKFCDSISGDWGGKPFVDLMKGLDYVEKTYPLIDKNRGAALGASYGGYMANWILGHTNRFKCI